MIAFKTKYQTEVSTTLVEDQTAIKERVIVLTAGQEVAYRTNLRRRGKLAADNTARQYIKMQLRTQLNWPKPNRLKILTFEIIYDEK